MAYNSLTVNLDSIRSITHPKVAQKIADNITAKIPVLNYLNKIGHKEYENGGFSYWLPVFKELQTAQAYTGTTVLDDIEGDPVTTSIYERKQITVPVVATGTKMLQNGGSNPEAIVDYLAMLLETSEESMKDAMAGQSLGIMSANADGDVGITGLQTFLPADNTTGTVGTLSRSTYAFWRHQADTVATGFNTDGLSAMRRAYFACVRGDETPTLTVMTQNAFINFQRALVGTINFGSVFQKAPPTAEGEAGFPTVKFYGTDVVFDSYCPTNTIYFLNLKYFKLMVHSERDMSIRDFITPSNQDALVARLYWAGNLVCNNLARQGRLGGLPETWA